SDPAALTTLLDVISRFDRYSVSNAILITEQMPTATRLADFDYWKSHEASIKKGEHGITIMEPREYAKADGSKGVSYEPKKVFDISQTTAEPKPVHKRDVDPKQLIKALTKTSPVEMRINNDLPEGTNALYSPDTKTISVRQGMTADEIFRALTPEIAKARAATQEVPSSEFHIIAVSYILCKRNDVSPPSLPKESPFAEMEPKAVRAALRELRTEANNMSAVIGKALETKSREAR
ncbi:MAG: hypothetical protein IJM45_04525, partial [Clostridia bacterium]|nr:hypothetical protein [Clostridia bacterium]